MSKQAPKHFFSKYASVNMSRSMFDYSNVDTCTIDVDYLYPNYVDMVIPGDTWKVKYTNAIRMIDPITVPMMDNLWCETHWWFVPFRLIWQNTKYFFGEKDRSPESDVDYSIPQVTFASDSLPTTNSIFDYMGIPIGDSNLTGAFTVNALPFRAYNLIYDEWYMDEQRGEYSYYNIGDSDTASTNYTLLKRGKPFDYFTSTLLEPQIGNPVDIPLGTTASVIGNGNTLGLTANGTNTLGLSIYSHDLRPSNSAITGNISVGSTLQSDNTLNSNIALGVSTDPNLSGLVADLSTASAATISTLRQAFQMQAYQERLALSGQRYNEYLYGLYGVISPDARLQRPEFLGKTKQRLTVQPVVQNSETASTPQGNLGAIVYGGYDDDVFTRSFTEHGIIISLINIYSDLTYYQGLDRIWSITSPLDIPIPIFSNLTDEPVLRKEILLTGDSTNDNLVFGYQERYAWAKYKKNSLRGLVRPNATNTIGFWSLAQQFDTTLTNNMDFINLDTDISRITVTTDDDEKTNHFIVNQKFDIVLTRELPLHSNPQLWMFGGLH